LTYVTNIAILSYFGGSMIFLGILVLTIFFNIFPMFLIFTFLDPGQYFQQHDVDNTRESRSILTLDQSCV
jgi:hypothetical protein